MGDSEVHDLGSTVQKEHEVGGLDVPMDGPGRMGVVEGFGNGTEDLARFARRDLATFLEEPLECHSFEELHHEVVRSDVEDGDDIRVNEMSRRLGLAPKPLEVSGRFRSVQI